MSLTQKAHQAIVDHLKSLNKPYLINSVDATCGNGHDTLFLLGITEQTVFGFDVQSIAVQQTQKRAKKLADNAKNDSIERSNQLVLINESHATMQGSIHASHPDVQVDAVMFNLGYLPRADKQITTTTDSTVSALNNAFKLLSDTGILTVICYRGHPGGMQEANAVVSWLEERQLEGEIVYQEEASVNQNETTPVLFIVKSLNNK